MSTFVGHTMPPATLHSFLPFPFSPLDQDSDSSHIPPPSLPVNPAADFDMTSATGHYLGAAPERGFQPRRTSTLSYRNSGARHRRDASYSRSPRNLVVVIPSPDLPLDQGRLGNVLSMGPRSRLSQGILMPLFPSMFGQLNAIAREYNFPSTAGLCLYLHINENGITMTPRISDNSWRCLFGHLFDGRPPSGGQQLPIGGSIEFDIDLNKARWFDTWVSGTSQDSDPVFPPVITSRAPLEGHWRGESQTIIVDERPVEDRWDALRSHTPVANSRPEVLRHLPKKLSLLDRLELHGVHVPPKSHDHPDHPGTIPTHGTYTASPILPSAVPQAVTSDLERRVNSWRATTELYPLSMIETYQPNPDSRVSAGVTTMDEYALERNFRQAVDIDEFLWSVTPVGPHSPAGELPIAVSRPSSVHIDRRANGTAPLTPTTVTSWAPIDDDSHSVVSSVTRLPSPDLGERVVEDVMAQRPRAVWGNSFGWRSAMTWKEVYPYSSIQTKPTIRVQLQDSNGLVHQYPNLVIYPTVGSHPDMRSPSNTFERLKSSPQPAWASSFGWQEAVTWRKVYPYSTVLEQQNDSSSNYPRLIIYPTAYPHFDIYPSIPGSVHIDHRIQASASRIPSTATTWGPQDDDLYSEINSIQRLPFPDLGRRILDDVDNTENSSRPWQMVWPFWGNMSQVETFSFDKSVFVLEDPHPVIYLPAHPHFELHPTCANVSTLQNQVTETLATSNIYPVLNIYPAVYPHFDIYPAIDLPIPGNIVLNVRHERVEMKLPSLYPNFDIYHACYPYNLDHIYPLINAAESTQMPIKLSRGYPWPVVYSPVYPSIIPYPGFSAAKSQLLKPEQSPHIFPPTDWKSVNVKLPIRYPLMTGRLSQTKESLVLQRARAYEQLIAVNRSSGTVGTKGTHSPFILAPSLLVSPVTQMAEVIENSKVTFH